MISTSTSSNELPVTEVKSKQDYHDKILISTTAAIAPSRNFIGQKHRHPFPRNKQNKLFSTLSDSLTIGVSDMSTSTTTHSRSLFTHPSSLSTCNKSPPILSAVHHQQQQHLNDLENLSSGDSLKREVEDLRQHTSLLVNLPLKSPTSLCCTASKANPLILQKMTRTIPSDKVSFVLLNSLNLCTTISYVCMNQCCQFSSSQFNVMYKDISRSKN